MQTTRGLSKQHRTLLFLLLSLSFLFLGLGLFIKIRRSDQVIHTRENLHKAKEKKENQHLDANNFQRSISEGGFLIDVRTPAEYQEGHIAGAYNLDYYNPSFVQDIKKLDTNETYLLYCRSGHRSGNTLSLMKELGFQKLYDLQGGILVWKEHKLPLQQ